MSVPIAELVVAQARRWPDRIAHQSADRLLNYRDLLGSAAKLGHYLRQRLSGDGSPVIISGHKEPEMLIGFLGCLLAGHPYVPIDSSAPASRASQIAGLAQARLCLTREQIAACSLDQTLDAVVGPISSSGDRLQYLMFTSGSTGEPKGVPITQNNVSQFVEWMQAEHSFTSGEERFLNQAIFAFDLSIMDTWLCLASGGTLVSLTKEEIGDPGRLFRALEASGVTTWVSTPTFAQLCLAERRFDQSMMPAMRRFLFCGERLGKEIANELLSRFPAAEIWNTYGPTEATVATTSIRVDRGLLERYPAIPIGRSAPGTVVEVRLADGSIAAPDQQGEIVISGPNVSPGYLGRPDLTEHSFGWIDGRWSYWTGDLGHRTDGLLFCDGRIDDQIKLNGYRIELGDIESNLGALPGITGAAVVAVTRGNQSWLVAFVTVGPNRVVDQTSLKMNLGDRLPNYMIPRRIRIIDTLPMTPNGKIDRKRLIALAQ